MPLTPAPTAGSAHLLLTPLTAQNLAVPHSHNFSCASQLTPNLKSLAGGSFVVAQASIDMTLKKVQQAGMG